MEQKKSEDNQIRLIATGPCSRVFADSVVVKVTETESKKQFLLRNGIDG